MKHFFVGSHLNMITSEQECQTNTFNIQNSAFEYSIRFVNGGFRQIHQKIFVFLSVHCDLHPCCTSKSINGLLFRHEFIYYSRIYCPFWADFSVIDRMDHFWIRSVSGGWRHDSGLCPYSIID